MNNYNSYIEFNNFLFEKFKENPYIVSFIILIPIIILYYPIIRMKKLKIESKKLDEEFEEEMKESELIEKEMDLKYKTFLKNNGKDIYNSAVISISDDKKRLSKVDFKKSLIEQLELLKSTNDFPENQMIIDYINIRLV